MTVPDTVRVGIGSQREAAPSVWSGRDDHAVVDLLAVPEFGRHHGYVPAAAARL